MNPRVKFGHWQCLLEFHRYTNARWALVLIDEETGERVAVATVNLPDYDLAEDEVAIKDYSENEGMLEALTKAGIVEYTGTLVKSGFVLVPICKLKVQPQ